MIKKVLSVVVLIVLLSILGYCGLSISQLRGCGCVEKIEKTAIERPYYVIQTDSLMYITKVEPIQRENRIEINDYYYKLGDEWCHREGRAFLNKDAYGSDIEIIYLTE